MSVVIVGGNECMTRRYKDICKSYKCEAKIFPKMENNLKNKIGSPDLLILFTSTMSHKMLNCAVGDCKSSTVIERSHSSSVSALKNILDKNTREA